MTDRAGKKNKHKKANKTISAVKMQEEPKQLFSIPNLCIALFIISFGLYFNTLWNGYVLDDGMVLRDNTMVKQGISAIPELLSTPHMRGYLIINNDLYRPLSLVMFAVEYQVFGLNPMVGHFFNILFFAGCVILLFLFLDGLFERKKTAVAFITAFLFALHPVHTEVVANIKSRDEIMCFFFAFLSLYLFLKYMQTGKLMQLALGSFCFFLSLLSKETAITFVVIIPFIFFFYRNENKKYGISITIGAIVVAAVFLAARFFVLQAYHANSSSNVLFIDNMLSNPPSVASGLATKILILGKYLALLFVPYPLICDYSYNTIPFVTFSNIWTLLSFAIYIFLAWLSVSRLIKKHNDPFAFAIIFYLVTLSLFSNFPFIMGAPMAERFMFFASVGFCLAVALVIEKWILRSDTAGMASLMNTKAMAILIPISAIYVSIAFDRNSDWSDNYTLYSTDVTKAPHNTRLCNNMAVELHNLSDMEQNAPAKQEQLLIEAKNYAQSALAVYPGNVDAVYSLGLCYKKLKVYDSAEACFKRGLALNPDHINTINGLGAVYWSTKRFPQAIDQFKKITILDPTNITGYSNLGGSYFNIKDYQSAIKNFRIVLSIDPQNKNITPFMARAWQMLGNMDSAIKYEAIAQENNPGFKL